MRKPARRPAAQDSLPGDRGAAGRFVYKPGEFEVVEAPGLNAARLKDLNDRLKGRRSGGPGGGTD